MNDDSSSIETPKSSWGRKLGLGLGGLLVLLIILYFVISSGAFLKGFILPRVAKALHMDIAVADASLSPFSQLTLDKLKVQPPGGEPLLTAEQVRVRYRLFSILGGNYVVDELTLAAPVIQITKEPNGTSNLDSLKKGGGESGSTSEGPLRLAVHNVNIKDGTVRSIDRAKDGSVKQTDLSHLNLTVDRFENGQSGKMTLASELRVEQRAAPATKGTNDLIQGRIDGGFDFKVDQKLLPQTVGGKATLALQRAAGAYAELAGLSAGLQADMTPSEVRQLALQFERGGRPLGRIQATGPLDLAKSEGRLKIEIQSIDRQVLNFFGASRGWDFADSQLNATNVVDFAKQGDVIGAKGQVTGRQLSIRQQGQAIPPLDLDVDYDVSINRTDQLATLRKFSVLGKQQQKEVLRATLDRPMTLTWAEKAPGFAESNFQLSLTNLNLKEWQSVLGTNLPSGRLNFTLNVFAKQDGKELDTKATATLLDAAAQIGTNRVDQAQLSASIDGTLANFKTLDLKEFTLAVQQLQQSLLTARGSVHYDLSKPDLSLQANAELALPVWLRLFPNPDLTAATGTVRVSSAVLQKSQKYSATGNLFLADFTGRYGTYTFQDYQTGLDYDVALEKPNLQVRSASLTVRKGYTAGGSVALSGDCDLDKKSAKLTFKLVDLNESAIGPFLAPSLGENKLVSISLSGSGSTGYDPQGETAVKADLSVTNWVVAAPRKQFVSPALGAQLQLDLGAHQQVIDLRQLGLKLSPTKNAKNELLVKAKLDLGKTNPAPSQLSVQAESLDLTPYYDMFAGSKPSTNASPNRATAAAATPKPAVATEKQVEPEPMTLPFQQFTADIKIDRLYLREIAITNLQTSAKIKGGEVTFGPLDFSVNGGPVSGNAALNLGVPGYIYDIALKADHLPVEPLSNSLTTNAPGTYNGNLYLDAKIKGAGITGPNLQKNLSGNLSLNLTNMNYEIVGRKVKRILEPISVALRVPELMQTPINWVSAKADLGKGQIDLQQFAVESQAFHAESKGVVPINEVLTNSSLNLPVVLSLRRTLAEKANLLPPNSPTNAVYAALPAFVTLTGTFGDPKSDINKLVLGGLLAKSLGGIVPMGGKAGTILQGVGGLLSGQGTAPAGANAQSGTNAPAATNTTANLVQGISSLLSQPKKERVATNAPATSAARATNAPAAPATTPATNKTAKPNAVGDLLNLLQKKQ